jgi:hypothetical protein
VLSWSRATRDLLKSFGWGIRALHQLATATMVPFPRRLPHTISLLEGAGFEPSVPREGNYAHETASFDRYDISLRSEGRPVRERDRRFESAPSTGESLANLTSSPRSPALQTGNYLDDAFGNPQ